MRVVKIKIPDPVYKSGLTLLIGYPKYINIYFKRKHPESGMQIDEKHGGNFITINETNSHYYYLYIHPQCITPDEIHGLLAHEIEHFTHAALNEIGCRKTKASEEAYTYYTAYITDQIYSRLKRRK